MPKLTAIELEKFQTISKHTIIPIRDLTLMFGPNGAGKSSIFDALEIMNTLFSDDWGKGNEKLNSYLDRWARKDGSEESADEIGFGFQYLFEEGWVPDGLPREKEAPLRHIAIASLSFRDYIEDFEGRNFKFYIKFKKSSYLGWSLEQLLFESDEKKFLEVATEGESNPRLDIYDVSWINLYPINTLKDKLQTVTYDKNRLSYYLEPTLEDMSPNNWLPHGIFVPSSADDLAALNQLEAVAQQIIDFFKIIFNKHFFAVDHKNLSLVKASRTVPSRDEVISIVSGETYKRSDGELGKPININHSTTLLSLANSLNKLQPHWSYLCASLAHTKSEDGANTGSVEWGLMDSIAKINWMLREDLFIENGYQLDGEVLCLTDIQEIADIWLENAKHYPKIVRLYLRDHQQRTVEIEDVGSGIGYILPVLASLAHDGRALIQQPELHLHPALQSALGDSIVRSIENYKYHDQFCLIETHSEHLLLRILKLLRNVEKRVNEVASPLSFDRVAVLYFEPQPDGTTKVHRLRLSPDGKLIDRWPGGFFNERYKDLFDDE